MLDDKLLRAQITEEEKLRPLNEQIERLMEELSAERLSREVNTLALALSRLLHCLAAREGGEEPTHQPCKWGISTGESMGNQKPPSDTHGAG